MARLHREAELARRLDHPDIVAVYEAGLQGTQARGVGRTDIDRQIIGNPCHLSDAFCIVCNPVDRVLVGTDIDTDNALAPPPGEPFQSRGLTLVVEPHTIDHGPILGQPEQPRLWIPALRAWRQSANLDKAETKTKHGIRNFGILVETGGQPNRGGKFKACQPDRECGICCRARHWREQPEGRNGQAMCTFGVERKQQGADKGKE